MMTEKDIISMSLSDIFNYINLLIGEVNKIEKEINESKKTVIKQNEYILLLNDVINNQ